MSVRLIELGGSAVFIGKDLRTISLQSVAGVTAMVLESVGPIRHAVNVPFHDSQARGKAILIRTGWDELQETAAYEEPGPYLHEELIFRLIRARVQLVGLDFAESNCGELIEKGIPVIERLTNLKSIPKWGARFYAVPPASAGPSAAIRAFAEVTSAESA